jgi:trimeric autotransporter adhesin
MKGQIKNMNNQKMIFGAILSVLACFVLLPQMPAASDAPETFTNSNTWDGFNALIGARAANTFSTADGWEASVLQTTALGTTSFGAAALAGNNATGNCAFGAGAATFTLSAGGVNALGFFALYYNNGAFNNAHGRQALFNNTSGIENNAFGDLALLDNTTGSTNTAVGDNALQSNTTGGSNVAVGRNALLSNTTVGNPNGDGGSVAVGKQALENTDATPNGDNNAIGYQALQANVTGQYNNAHGWKALTLSTGSLNTALGDGAGGGLTTGDGNVYIGAAPGGAAVESNHTYIRNINTTSVSGLGTDTVTVNLATGLLGHLTSSRRYKEDIKPMENASEALYQLKPVSYRYKQEIDPTRSPAFGLIAEQVAQVNPALVACNADGQVESVHYEMVNAMLLNEFLKEHRTVQELKSTVAEQRKQIDALAAGLQKVSAQLEMSKPATKVVVGNQ